MPNIYEVQDILDSSLMVPIKVRLAFRDNASKTMQIP